MSETLTAEEAIKNLNEYRDSALETANDVYYDKESPHYRNNERYSWAVKTINKRFDEKIQFIRINTTNHA